MAPRLPRGFGRPRRRCLIRRRGESASRVATGATPDATLTLRYFRLGGDERDFRIPRFRGDDADGRVAAMAFLGCSLYRPIMTAFNVAEFQARAIYRVARLTMPRQLACCRAAGDAAGAQAGDAFSSAAFRPRRQN